MLLSADVNRQGAFEYDASLLWAAIALLGLGLVMVYSASIASAEVSRFTGGKSSYFLYRHLVFLVASIGLGSPAKMPRPAPQPCLERSALFR